MPKVIVLMVGEGPEVREVPEVSLKFMQSIVGGYVETAFRLESPAKNREIDFYCNEEGLLEGLELNIITPEGTPIVGNIVVVAGDTNTGESDGLTDAEIAVVKKAYTPIIYI